MDDFILLRRNVEATQIPSGQLVHLPEGTPVSITQSLGGTFTVHASPGGLYRIGAADADALGKEAPEVAQVTFGPFSEELLWGALREVYDPEIPVNIVDLGLVYSLRAEPVEGEESRRVTVEMTLTAPGCGMGPSLAADARERLRVLPGVAEADVHLVWDPPWGPERISPAGRSKLGID
jgi:probable FeS assembly SUF system protein SufT